MCDLYAYLDRGGAVVVHVASSRPEPPPAGLENPYEFLLQTAAKGEKMPAGKFEAVQAAWDKYADNAPHTQLESKFAGKVFTVCDQNEARELFTDFRQEGLLIFPDYALEDILNDLPDNGRGA
jgi:hypothetical protein